MAGRKDNIGKTSTVKASVYFTFPEFVAGVYSIIRNENINYEKYGNNVKSQIRYERGRHFAIFANSEKIFHYRKPTPKAFELIKEFIALDLGIV